ncbi:SGNH/GDSL hydrolase family protein [Rhizomicrobium palustre]
MALPLAIGGRVVAQGAGDEARYVYAWPGVWFEAQFAGPAVDVKVDDSLDNLYVYVDGAHKLTLTRPGKTTVSLKDLGPGAHIVRLEKASETQNGSGAFGGFYVPSSANVLPAPVYQKKIEFIGDSYTVGYGNASRGQICTTADVDDTTDTSRAFAPAVAKHFGAAYRIHAFSGRGIVRNYNGIVPGETLPYLYQFTLFDKSVGVAEDGWVPDVIVIGLGTNDFSTALHAGEAWATREALDQDFVAKYIAFVKDLHAKYPAAHFVLMASDHYESEIARSATAVADGVKAQGVDVETIIFTGLDYMACHGHPSLKDDALLAQMLVDRLSLLPKFAPQQASR